MNSFNSSISSDFSFSVKLALIEIGLVLVNQILGQLPLTLLLPQPVRLFLLQLPHPSLLLFPNFLELHSTPNSRVAILRWGPLASQL